MMIMTLIYQKIAALRRKLILMNHEHERITLRIEDRGQIFQNFESAWCPWTSKGLYIFCCPWCGTTLTDILPFDIPFTRARQNWER